MKAVVYASEIIASRIRPILIENGVEMIAFSGKVGGEKLDYLLENLDEIELAILDTLEEYADFLCDFFAELGGLPVVLLVDHRVADWEKLCGSKASAFIPYSAGEMELAARLKNVIARTISVRGKKTRDAKEN